MQDPSAPFIGEDGFEYRSLADYICDKPAQTTRNGNVRCYRKSGYRADAIQAYWEGFDNEDGPTFLGPSEEFGHRHDQGLRRAIATGGFGPPHTWGTARSRDRQPARWNF